MLESNLYYLLKFAVPVMLFVVVELVPLRGGNKFETRSYNKILVPFRGVLEIFWTSTPVTFLGEYPPRYIPHSFRYDTSKSKTYLYNSFFKPLFIF